MSGPSAMAKPMSPKIAAISSMTWLIGWMRPRSAGDWRTGSVTSSFSAASRAVDRGVLQFRLAGGQRLGDAVLQAVDGRALHLALLRRSSRRASSAVRRPSPSCRARRCAPLRWPARRRRPRSRPEAVRFKGFHGAHGHVRRPITSTFAAKKNPRQPCQRGFPKSEVVVLGKRWSRRQRFQKRSASCS